MAELQLTGLTKAFAGAPVLSSVDLRVESGRLISVLGASGSGKTTLLRLVCGFERADAGRIRIGGHEIAGPGLHVAAHRRRVGYVAQEGALFPHLSVAGNVGFGLDRRQRRQGAGVDALLRLVGLSAAYGPRLPHQLSGGEQQRVALARALAPRPALVLLDEPFSALDAALRQETRQAVADAIAESGATALLVTHDQSEALSMGHEVAVLRHGSLVQVADPRTLYRSPVDAALARFVGEAVLLDAIALGEGTAHRADCALGRLPLARPVAAGAVQLLLRPEQIRLQPTGVAARVGSVAFFGPDAMVRLVLLEGGLELVARLPGHLAPEPGSLVRVQVEGPAVAFPPPV